MSVAEQGRANLEAVFGRHETFAPRYGWFKKIVDGVEKSPVIFAADDATLQLGVGKNMVRSMRFWAGAGGLVVPRLPVRREELLLSPLAKTLFADDGWDPYLEVPATVWLLHWKLLGPGCQLPVWWFAFNDFTQPDFSATSLSAAALDTITAVYGMREPAASSVRRDAECLVHTYARRVEGRVASDDALACPFRALGLVEQEPGRAGLYRFRVGPKPSLPADVIAFAALEFSSRQSGSTRSVALGRLLRDTGSPGKVFKLDEDSLITALTTVARRRKDLQVTDTAGVSALIYDDRPATIALDVLNSYFARVTQSARCLKALHDVEDDLLFLSESIEPAAKVGRSRRGRSDATTT